MSETCSMGENLKKATSEMLMLRLLNERSHYIGETAQALERLSNGWIRVGFPYAVFLRMEKAGYVEAYKKISPDGRRRIYYSITTKGKKRYQMLRAQYDQIVEIVAQILS